MSNSTEQSESNSADEFSRQAEQPTPGIAREFYDFLCENKAWWLAPIILSLLLVGVLVVLSGTAAAPFIYTLW